MDQAAQQKLIAWDKELQTEQEKHLTPLVGTEEDPYLIYEKVVADFPDEVYLLYKEAIDKNPSDHFPASVVSDPESIDFVKRSYSFLSLGTLAPFSGSSTFVLPMRGLTLPLMIPSTIFLVSSYEGFSLNIPKVSCWVPPGMRR